MLRWTLEFDGLHEPRGRADAFSTYGFVAQRGDETIHEGRGLVAPPGGGGGPHVAEFAALIEGLTWLRDHGARGVRVLGDSRLVIETVAGRWTLSSARLRPLWQLARRLAAEVEAGPFEKVPRDANARADALSRQAWHAARAAHPEWRDKPAARL